jgi:hypothetical protein
MRTCPDPDKTNRKHCDINLQLNNSEVAIGDWKDRAAGEPTTARDLESALPAA